MAKHRQGRVRDRLNPNPSRPCSLIYVPIEDWRTDEVWIYLNQWQNPWGNSNKDLFTMYRGATADNECPLVVDTSTPSCGSSRFGCWVCTMVDKDKSMEAMIQNDEEKEWMQPLLDIRNDLDVEDDRPKRDFRRIYGRVELFERNVDGAISVEPMPGPYTKYWREHWLRRVLEAQTQVRRTAPPEMRDITLITHEELSEIRRIWLEEKHEFDDSLPRIYEEVTGEPFQDTRPSAEKKLLGSDEWTVLNEICEDEMHLELMARLLHTESQYHAKSRRGIYESLDKCFASSSRSKDEAIENAHYQRNLKNTVKALKDDRAEIHEVRQQFEQSTHDEAKQLNLNWASLKFSAKNSDEENSDD
jgi:DNA sulfur modification protein DndC